MANSYEKIIPVSELTVDHKVQRINLDHGRVNKMIADFNPDAVGALTVSERKDGSLILLDGWHRWEAVRRITSNEGEVLCKVFTDLSLPEEAALFLKLNTTNQPKLMDRFMVRVVGGDKHASEMNQIANSYGWTIDPVVGDKHINAIAAVERVYWFSKHLEVEPNLFQQVLIVVNRAWGHDRYGVQAGIMDGLGRLLGEHRLTIDLDRLVNALKGYKGGAEGLLTQARGHANVQGMRLPYAVADLVTAEYNKGARTKRLSPWRTRR